MATNPRKTLSDLRPAGGQIQCLYCDQSKPAAGAERFRAHAVCADCATKLKTSQPKAQK